MPSSIFILRDASIDYVSNLVTEVVYEEFEIRDLRHLLFLQTISMMEASTMIKKCKNCHEYFIPNPKNEEYCERKAPGKNQPCSKIGAKCFYNENLKETPALETYERVRNTHFERDRRVKKIKNKSDEIKDRMIEKARVTFETWDREALEKLELVKSGNLSVFDFESWCKI